MPTSQAAPTPANRAGITVPIEETGEQPAPARPGTLVPPRPNLGPEPWQSPTRLDPIGLLVASVAVVGFLAWALARRHRARPAGGVSEVSAESPGAPTEPVVAWAEEVRAALAARLGPAWSARTTEEIAADAGLEALIGPDRRAFLLQLLREADRFKFAVDPAPAPDREAPADLPGNPFDPATAPDDWSSWVAGLLAILNESKPVGSRSSAGGR